uniref:C-type lectin domain-containing protein n=1 Tax=Accipiter nisus TaxID=211598 RepID=A0A8B9LVD8_9AVES
MDFPPGASQGAFSGKKNEPKLPSIRTVMVRACFELSPLIFLLDKQLSGELKAIHTCGRLPALAYAFSVFFFSHHFPSEIICTRCPAGWQQFDKTCYFFSSTTKPCWLDAKEICADQGAHLVIINSEQEQVSQLLCLKYPFSWRISTPNKDKDQKDCGSIGPGGIWNDDRCSHTNHWICEKSWNC